MYKELDFCEVSQELLQQLQKGAFLTVKSGDKVNTMTIAWGSLGYMWNRPVFTAMVRYSRYTYELIKDASEFTVSFPLKEQLGKALNVCGTKSGRDIDKFEECGLTLGAGVWAETPVIDDCELHLECRIVYSQGMNAEKLDGEIRRNSYPDGNYHVFYFGEIVKVLRKGV